MSTEVTETSKRKRETPEEKSNEEKSQTTDVNNDAINETGAKEESTKAPSPKRPKESEASDTDSDCISQEDLLAQLGLNSVKKLQTTEPDPNRVVHPEPPKQSILELLKQPCSRKVLPSSAMPNKERPFVNGSFAETPGEVENIDSKEKLIVRLQTNLRNEEAKLMLLRKLYACQNEKVQKEVTTVQARTTSVTVGTTTQANTTTSQRKVTVAAGNQKQLQQQQQKPQKQTQKLQKSQQKPPPPVLMSKPPQPAVQPRVVFLSQPRGPQPVIIAPKLVPTSSQDLKHDRQMKVQMVSATTTKPTHKPHQQSIPPTTLYAHNTGSTSKRSVQAVHVLNDNNRLAENGLPKPMQIKKMRSPPTPEQSHAEAKMALRKQLEKTLLEIPLPKPPVQDWNFVPSVNTHDFTILVGLEGVANHIVESAAMTPKPDKEEKIFTPPKFCSQCDTDFTPGWRLKVMGNESTLCESCYTQKIKKSLKTEHTTRLKDAFMKALKQEQEVEKKFQLSGVSVSTAGKTSATVKPQTVRASSSHQAHHQPPPARIVYHPVHSIQPQVYQPHHSIVHQLQQQQLQQQHQELDSRQDGARFFTYVGQPQPKRHNYTTDNDRQREYLLDMIPSRTYRI